MNRVLPFRRRPTPSGEHTQVTLLVELDGDIPIAVLAQALATHGLTFGNNPKTGRLRIREIPPFLRKET